MHHRALIESLEFRQLLSVSPADTSFLPPVTVSGIVFADTVKKNNEPDAGEGLAGCVVTFNNNLDHTVSTPVTGADGSYTTTLEPGSYHLTVDGPTVSTPYDNANFVVGISPIMFNVEVSTDSSGASTGGGTSKPDLAVSVSSLPSPLVVTTKATPVTVSITNKGDDYTGPVSATLYFSTDKVIDSGDKHTPTLTFTNVTVTKKKPKTATINIAPLLPLLPAGNYFLIAKVTATGDTNLANNTVVSKVINVAAPSAVILPSISGSLAPTKGRTIPFSLSLKNSGNAAGVGSAAFSVTARSSTGVSTPLAVPQSSFSVAPGSKAVTIGKSISLAALPAGKYHLIVNATFALTSPIAKSFSKSFTGPLFTLT